MTYDSKARYAESHEWCRKEGELVVVGISDYAQDSLGDIVYVEQPQVGATLQRGTPFGVVESVKAASDINMPIDGEVVEVNGALDDNPALVNESPFAEGWLIKIRPANPTAVDALMDALAYEEHVKTAEA